MSSGPDWVDWVGLLGYREDLILFLSGCLQCFSQQRQWNQGITFIWDPVHLVPTRILKKKESQSSHKTQQSVKAARYCQQNLKSNLIQTLGKKWNPISLISSKDLNHGIVSYSWEQSRSWEVIPAALCQARAAATSMKKRFVWIT